MEKVSSKQFAYNALWKFIELISSKVVSLIISIVLARLLMPEAYGIVALTTIFITFSNIFIQNGFNIALIRNEHISDIYYSTVMLLSGSFATILYLLIFIGAPWFANFYGEPQLSSLLRTITILLFFQSISSVIKAKGTRELCFKKMSLIAFIATTVSGIVGVIMAYLGCGVWSLVVQQILTFLIEMILLIILFRWRFSLRFSWSIAKEMLHFTFGVLGASFIDFFGNSTYNLVIGKTYSTADLGYYSKGYLFPEVISLNTYNAINSVLLPTLATRQNDHEDLKQVSRKVLSFTLYIIFPMMGGLLITADNFIPFLLTDKWNPCIPLLRYSCIYYALNPIRAICCNIYYSKGDSKRSAMFESVRTILMIAVLAFIVLVYKGDVYTIGLAGALISIIMAVVAFLMSRSVISYKFTEFIKDVLPSLILTLIMMLCAYFAGSIVPNHAVSLFAQIIVGVIVYLGLSALTKSSNLKYIITYITNLLMKTKKFKIK